MNPFRGNGYFVNIELPTSNLYDRRERLVSKKSVGLADTRPIWLYTPVLHHRLLYISGMYKRQLYALQFFTTEENPGRIILKNEVR